MVGVNGKVEGLLLLDPADAERQGASLNLGPRGAEFVRRGHSSRSPFGLAVESDQVVRGAVVGERGFGLAFNLRNDALRQHLAQFDSPLVEGIDVPDCALRKDRMFVEGHEFAEYFRRQLLGQDRVRWTIAFEDAMRNEPLCRAFGFDLFRSFAEGERLGLRTDVRDQYVVMPAQRVERLHKSDKVARDQPSSLVDQLIKRVLAVGPRFAPVDRTGLVRNLLALQRDVL